MRPRASRPTDVVAPTNATTLKIKVPTPPRRLVPRPRLISLLGPPVTDEADPPQVVLVTGPAGAGKTTFLSSWAASPPADGPPTRTGGIAWVTVDAGDGVGALWSAILAAFEDSGTPGRSVEFRRIRPPRGSAEPEFVAGVARSLGRLREPLWLVLDQVEHLTDPEVVRSVDMLLRWTPHALRLVLAGRAEPPLALHRLRVQGWLREIRAHDLALTRTETAELLLGHGIRLDEADIDVVQQRTEGWAAGVRLAAMSLEGVVDPHPLVVDLAGDDRAVADYLVGEILSRQPERIREFLLRTSVCDQLTPDLAAALTGQDDAGEILEQLARANALTLRFGGPERWYRCHTLLRSYLSAELDRRRPSARPGLHRLAARWFAERNDTLRAIEHAVAARDVDQAGALVEQAGLRLVTSGQGPALARLLAAAPAEVLAHPPVALASAAAALDRGEIAVADDALARVPRTDTRGETTALHATLTLRRAQLKGDFADELRDLDDRTAGQSGNRDLDLLVLVDRGTARLRLGRLDAAEADLERAVHIATDAGRDHVLLRCLVALAGVSSSRNDFTEMARRAERAIVFAAERGWDRTPQCHYGYVLAASGAYQSLDDECARRYAHLATATADAAADPSVRFATTMVGAVVMWESGGDRRARLEAVRRAWPALDMHVAPALIAHATVAYQRMCFGAAEPGRAEEAVPLAEQRLGDAGEICLLRAVGQVHRGRVDAGRRLLSPVLLGTVESVVVGTLIEAWLLEATLADAAGNDSRGYHALGQALELAAPRGALRPFHDAGRRVRNLLARHTGRFGRDEAFARRALTALPAPVDGRDEDLTEREHEILAELPSLRTAAEIGVDRFVSVNTVKTHLRSIYRKLGVQNRRDAVVAARRRGLL